MGGSGGGGGSYFPRKPQHVDSMVRRAQEQAERDRREAETNEELLSLLAQFYDRDIDATRTRLEEVQDCLGSEIEIDTILYGGSVAKHTYVDGLSDVDALVVLSEENDGAPDALRSHFKELLERRLPMTGVESIREGDLAVTVRYHDGTELQLLPARRTDVGVAIASPSGRDWSSIRPKAFAEALTKVNQEQAGSVVPTIKFAKSLISGVPSNQRLSGYHVEALAVEAFRGYDGRRTPVAMMRHFFAYAADRVRNPITDITGQTATVDAYLGPAGSTERKLVSDRLATVSRQLNAAASSERWKQLIVNDEF